MKTIARIVAGESGVRFNSELPKQVHVVKEKAILEYTLDAFSRHSGICSMILAPTPS
jgi:2-C-methyl-D-erythritol 4-phosphate cytidylyltransferase